VRRLAAIRDEFAHDLAASMRATMARHGVDYVPGCADLGDFDATSTTIALDPVQAGSVLPPGALERTFARYWDLTRDRASGAREWVNYTPYEARTIGAVARLGWRGRADSLLTWLLADRNPPAWQQWGEIVWHDRTQSRFIGDLPHTWVGSDFVRSALDLLAYEREADSSLVLASGVPKAWLMDTGLRVRGLSTAYGTLGYTLRRLASGIVEARLEGGCRVPPGGVVLRPPGDFQRATVDGAPVALGPAGEVVLHALPATVTFRP